MPKLDHFDPAPFGRREPVGWSEEECHREVDAFFLETKSGDPREALRVFLDDMAAEMRAQFDSFRKLRVAADIVAKANADGGGGDDAAAKLARADIKAAVDAMSLIVRTLEKVDALQRQIARDHELESERHADGAGYEEAKKRLIAIVEQRVSDRVEAILAERDRGDQAPDPSGRTGLPAPNLPRFAGDVTKGDRGG